MNDPIHIISLGAGVQSSTMALMAAHGEITPMPTAAIFADTQDEPAGVYKWLDWLETKLPFPVHRVTKGKLSDAVTNVRISKKGSGYTDCGIPAFITSGIAVRQCTQKYKIEPIRKMARKLRGKGRVVQWIGISLDEPQRMKTSRDAWCINRWPLIEKEMTRHDCLRWMEKRGYPKPAKSACVYCPYHRTRDWREMRDGAPEDFAAAVAFEKRLQAAYAKTRVHGLPYLHKSKVTLDLVDLTTDTDFGQGLLDGFNNECEGMCGV